MSYYNFKSKSNVWVWEDPVLEMTGFIVDESLEVTYLYKGSTRHSGDSDPQAAVRAYKAWRRWEDKPDGLWCLPARRELEGLYERVAPDVAQEPPDITLFDDDPFPWEEDDLPWGWSIE